MVKRTKKVWAPTALLATQRLCLKKPNALMVKAKRINILTPRYKVTYEYMPKYKYTYKGKTHTGPNSCRKSCTNPLGKNSARCKVWRKKIQAQNVSLPNPFSGGGGGNSGGGGGNENNNDNGGGDEEMDVNKIFMFVGIGLAAIIILSVVSVGGAVYIKKKRASKKKDV